MNKKALPYIDNESLSIIFGSNIGDKMVFKNEVLNKFAKPDDQKPKEPKILKEGIERENFAIRSKILK